MVQDTHLGGINRIRMFAGRVAAVCCAVLILSALDGLVAQFREPPDEVRLIVGSSTRINGSAPETVKTTDDLETSSSSDRLQIAMEGIYSGFWLGGRMWRGQISASDMIEAGEYKVSVRVKKEPVGKVVGAYRVVIFPDLQSLKKNSLSFIERHLGVSSWLVFVISLVMTPLALGLVYFAAQRREELLARLGRADIYHIAIHDYGYEVAFALGRKHGIQEGKVLELLDENGIMIGTVTVKEVFEKDSKAVAPRECSVRVGYMVSL